MLINYSKVLIYLYPDGTCNNTIYDWDDVWTENDGYIFIVKENAKYYMDKDDEDTLYLEWSDFEGVNIDIYKRSDESLPNKE